MAHIILFGNEKGGAGKTTSAMHLIINLLKLGHKVASLDLDSRQKSLTAYIENRARTAQEDKIDLELPMHNVVEKSNSKNSDEANNEEEQRFTNLINNLHQDFDTIVIDTPGSDSFLSRLAHSYADTVITPINDSFVDLDLIGKVEAKKLDIIKPGIYSAMLWEQKLKKAAREKKQIDWVLIRNRLSATDAINKRNIEITMIKLAKKFGFRIMPGFGDRVIFRELFLYGLTLHDAKIVNKVRMSPSVIAARQEWRDFIIALNLDFLKIPKNF